MSTQVGFGYRGVGIEELNPKVPLQRADMNRRRTDRKGEKVPHRTDTDE